jgi:hypothetical protein
VKWHGRGAAFDDFSLIDSSHSSVHGASSDRLRWCSWLYGAHNFPAASHVSNYLLVMLQYFGLGPGVLLCTHLLLAEIRVNEMDEVSERVRPRGQQLLCRP